MFKRIFRDLIEKLRPRSLAEGLIILCIILAIIMIVWNPQGVSRILR